VDKPTVDQLRKEAEESWTKLSLLKDAYFKAESDYIKKLNKFKDADYKLAQEDGRLKKLPPSATKERKTQKQPGLTIDQLKSIADKLGVKLTVECDVEEEVDEEIVDAIMSEEGGCDEAQVQPN
jgi:hypothetical protein